MDHAWLFRHAAPPPPHLDILQRLVQREAIRVPTQQAVTLRPVLNRLLQDDLHYAAAPQLHGTCGHSTLVLHVLCSIDSRMLRATARCCAPGMQHSTASADRITE
eukprot:352507-Chlamydomonas_euryale.AAC.9